MGIRRRELSWYAYQLPLDPGGEFIGVIPVDEKVQFGRWVDDGSVLWRPSQSVYRLVDGEWRSEVEDLLPGYVLRAGNRCPAVSIRSLSARLVSRCPVSRDEVRRIEEHESTVVHYSRTRLKVGDRAFVKFGAKSSFAGLEGRIVGFEAAPGKLYAHLVLDVYGSHRDVWLGADQVERLKGRGRKRWRMRGGGGGPLGGGGSGSRKPNGD